MLAHDPGEPGREVLSKEDVHALSPELDKHHLDNDTPRYCT